MESAAAVSYEVCVITHPERQDRGERLAEALGASWYVDLYGLGVAGSHLNVLSSFRHVPDHLVVLEDDAIPSVTFHDEIVALLGRFPDDLISLYLGRVYPPQHQRAIQHRISRARSRDVDHVKFDHLMHGVGYVLPSARIQQMLPLLRSDDRTIDRRIGWAWRQVTGRPVIYPLPSIVDHDDDLPSLVKARRPGRRAWVPPTEVIDLRAEE